MSVVLTRPLLVRAQQRPPVWAYSRFLGWEVGLFPHLPAFATHVHRCERGSVDLTRVVGTTESEHVGRSWLELLTTGAKMPENLALYAGHPDYYRDTAPKTLAYVSLDGFDWYVTTGHHRTCIARFDLHYRRLTHLHGVRTEQYGLDRELHDLYDELVRVCRERALPYRLSPHSTLLYREEGPGWCLERYRPAISMRIGRLDPPVPLATRSARELLERVKGHRHRRFWTFLPGRQAAVIGAAAGPDREVGSFGSGRAVSGGDPRV